MIWLDFCAFFNAGGIWYNSIMYEVFLARKVTGADAWDEFLGRLARLHRVGEKFELMIDRKSVV